MARTRRNASRTQPIHHLMGDGWTVKRKGEFLQENPTVTHGASSCWAPKCLWQIVTRRHRRTPKSKTTHCIVRCSARIWVYELTERQSRPSAVAFHQLVEKLVATHASRIKRATGLEDGPSNRILLTVSPLILEMDVRFRGYATAPDGRTWSTPLSSLIPVLFRPISPS